MKKKKNGVNHLGVLWCFGACFRGLYKNDGGSNGYTLLQTIYLISFRIHKKISKKFQINCSFGSSPKQNVSIARNPVWMKLRPRRTPKKKNEGARAPSYSQIHRTASFVLCPNLDLALRELGPQLTKLKSPMCDYREREICTNSELISRSLEIVTSFTTPYFVASVGK